MTSPALPPSDSRSPPLLGLTVALASAALIAFEVGLMRRLLIESWHHFGFLVISVALLGFGASGTLLATLRRPLHARPAQTMRWLALVLVATLLGAPRLATGIPVSAHFAPSDLGRSVGAWCVYWALALTPFLSGATLLGAALMTAGRQVHRIYAANLLGSAAGAALGLLVVSRWPVTYLLTPSAALALLGWLSACSWTPPLRLRRLAGAIVVVACALVIELRWPLTLRYDEFKYAAHLQRLVAQGTAERVAARADPHGYVELYASDRFHDLPFLALQAAPPPMYSLTLNGDAAGSVLRISDPTEAAVLDQTLMAFPFRLAPPAPRVLLLGETGGINAWLGLRQQAAAIDAVQPNAAIVALLEEHAAALVRHPNLRFHARAPRAYLRTQAPGSYDLIQIVALEGLGIGSASPRGLAEDHLATVEGFAECLRALAPEGVLTICRGIQQPPRENIRIFATLVTALEGLGVADPGKHIVQVRDYLGVCTLALRSPLSERGRQHLRRAIEDFNLTPVWYAGVRADEVNQPDALDGPGDSSVDWLHFAATEILSPRRGQFYRDWLLNVRPVRDDDPFFWDFYKPQAIGALRAAYGELWLTRAEIGRLFLYAALMAGGAVAILLILVPLTVRGRAAQVDHDHPGTADACARNAGKTPSKPRQPGLTIATLTYFAGIGLGFMGLEMALISRAIHWLGDPVIASAVVIGGVLVLSGFGSLTAPGLLRNRPGLATAVVASVAVVLRLTGWAGATPWGLILVAPPMAYLMGIPMPSALALLTRGAPRLLPWAWGVNGVASVIATSGAVALAMSFGYRTVCVLAAGAYGLAALSGIGRASPPALVPPAATPEALSHPGRPPSSQRTSALASSGSSTKNVRLA